jgi:hypothetical protein
MTCTHDNNCYDQDKNFQKLFEHNCEGECPAGWVKGGGGKQGGGCQCCVTDWETATLNIWSDGKKLIHDTSGVKIADKFKVPCCLGYDGGFDRTVTCSPNWCPSNLANKSCDEDQRVKDYCMKPEQYPMSSSYNGGCDLFCSVKQENGLMRKQDPNHWCHSALLNYCAEGDSTRSTPADPLCTNYRYDCNDDGSCTIKLGGQYLEDPNCGGKCIPKLYYCNNQGKCDLVKDGDSPTNTYKASDCNKECKPPRYACEDGICKENPNGKYTDKICGGNCIKYNCVDQKCVLTDGGSFLNLGACKEKCGVVPDQPKTYDCTDGQCVINKNGNGKYTDKNCNGDCKPTKIKYGCSGTDCKPMDDGEYDDNNCSEKCGSVQFSKYDCDKDGKCVPNPDGQYYSDDCSGKCSPSNNVKTQYIIGGSIALVLLFLFIASIIKMKRK